MTDREQRLQSLAAESARLAEMEHGLIETIRENKRRLIQLPGIIRRLEAKRERVTAEMERTGAEHDALEAEPYDAKFHAWATEMAAAITDEQVTTRHPSY